MLNFSSKIGVFGRNWAFWLNKSRNLGRLGVNFLVCLFWSPKIQNFGQLNLKIAEQFLAVFLSWIGANRVCWMILLILVERKTGKFLALAKRRPPKAAERAGPKIFLFFAARAFGARGEKQTHTWHQMRL